MAVWAPVTSATIAEAERWDPEYFHPSYAAVSTRLHNDAYPRLGQLAKLRCSAFYPAATQLYTEDGSGLPFLRCVDINEHPIIQSDQPFERIPEAFVRRYKSVTSTSGGSIVMSKVGSPCFTSYIDDDIGEAALTRTVLGIQLPPNSNQVNPLYLVAFLRSKYGFFQLIREREQQIQFQLTLDRVRRIRVFLPDRPVQDEIGELMRRHSETLKAAKQAYVKASNLLIEELDIRVDALPETPYVASSGQLMMARRWDGEFFKPRYQRTAESVLQAPLVQRLVPIGRMLQFLTNGHTPLRHDLSKGDVLFLTAEHVTDFEVDYTTTKRIRESHHAGELARTAVRDGDLLLTIKGRVGNCAVVRNVPAKTNINQDVALLRLRRGTHPYFLAAWINSPVGRHFVEQRSTGGINPFLGLGNVRQLPFPVIPKADEDRIGELVRKSIEAAQDLRTSAERLVVEATQRVEALIEA